MIGTAYRYHSTQAWARARADYLSGMSAASVCHRFGMGLSAFRTRARREGWRRADQAAPHADATEPLTLSQQIDQAWRALCAAVRSGRAIDALRLERSHADLTALRDRNLDSVTLFFPRPPPPFRSRPDRSMLRP